MYPVHTLFEDETQRYMQNSDEILFCTGINCEKVFSLKKGKPVLPGLG